MPMSIGTTNALKRMRGIRIMASATIGERKPFATSR